MGATTNESNESLDVKVFGFEKTERDAVLAYHKLVDKISADKTLGYTILNDDTDLYFKNNGRMYVRQALKAVDIEGERYTFVFALKTNTYLLVEPLYGVLSLFEGEYTSEESLEKLKLASATKLLSVRSLLSKSADENLLEFADMQTACIDRIAAIKSISYDMALIEEVFIRPNHKLADEDEVLDVENPYIKEVIYSQYIPLVVVHYFYKNEEYAARFTIEDYKSALESESYKSTHTHIKD